MIPHGPETILERLGRVAAERDRLYAKVEIQERELASVKKQLTTVRNQRTNDETAQQILRTQLEETQTMLTQSQKELAIAAKHIDNLKQTAENLDSIELARLNAERNFDLLARILRMSDHPDSVSGLKDHVNDLLSQRTEGPSPDDGN